MDGFIGWIISIALTVPIISLMILYIIIRIFVDSKEKSILLAVDLSTIIFIISVHFHLMTIFEQSFLPFILLFLLCLLLIVFSLEHRKSNVTSVKKITRTTWRISFLLFVTGYFILTVYGMTAEIVKNTLFL